MSSRLYVGIDRETQIILDEIKSWCLVEADYGYRNLDDWQHSPVRAEMADWLGGLKDFIRALQLYLVKPASGFLDLTELAPMTRWRILHMIMDRAAALDYGSCVDEGVHVVALVELREAARKLWKDES